MRKLAASIAIAVAIVGTASPAFAGTIADYYGDPGTGHASTTDSPYITAMTAIEAKQLPYLRKACARPHAALVLDVDDTTLLTYDARAGDPSGKKNRLDWVTHERYPATPGMVALATSAKQSGCRLIAITGRAESQRTATIANLAKVGYPSFAKVYARPTTKPSYLHCSAQCTTIQYKSQTRAHLEHAGFDIVADFGDQRSDLVGGHAGRQVKLPNPMYTIP